MWKFADDTTVSEIVEKNEQKMQLNLYKIIMCDEWLKNMDEARVDPFSIFASSDNYDELVELLNSDLKNISSR
ncbi:Hypothetical predicted protein, partial [Paramuricea clavata]